MRCKAIVSVLSFLFLVMASSSTALAANPVPFLSSPLQPSAAIPGSGGFTLTVNGSNFVSGATVNWNGSARSTTFVNSSQLTATILAADVASAGTSYVTVTNPSPGGGVSNSLPFEITNPITNISLAAPTNLSLGYDLRTSQPTVFTGDFNNDGKLDLLLAPLNSGVIDFSILLGNGDGTFAAPVRYSVPLGLTTGYLQNVVVGDFNGDGKPDVFVTFVNTGGVPPFPTQYTMFFGNGDGTFTVIGHQNQAFISSIDHAVTADFNKDGHLDIAGVCTTNGTPQVVGVCILNGDGAGNFTQTDVYVPMGGSGTFDGVAIGDFNRDGILDFAISDVSQNQVGLFIVLGNANGTYSAGGGVYAGNGAVSSAGGGIAVADLNGDGFLDLVMTEVDTANCPGPGGAVTCQTAFLTSFLGNGDGTFQGPRRGSAFTPSQGPLTPIIADLNGDGNPDIVTQNQILLLTNNTSSHLLTTAPFNVLAVGDVNGDGKADLIGPGSDSTHLGEALQLPPTPDFYGVANPTYQNVTPGATAVYPITVTATDGFTGTVQFAVSGLPAGAIATFNPTTVSGGGNAVLSVSTSPSTPTGVYVLTLTGTSGTLSHSGFLQLAVAPAGTDLTDFTGSVSPSFPSAVTINTSINPPPPASVQINVVPIRGFTGNVNFSVAGLPSGVTASFSPNPLIGGSGTVVLTLSANKSVAAGTYPLTITATSGSHTHSAGVGLNIGPAGAHFGDFTGSVSPRSQTVLAGGAANYSVTIVGLYGFTGGVVLSATNLPPGATLLGTPIVSGGAGTTVMTIQTSPGTPVGTYTIGIQGNASNLSGPLVHATPVTLTVAVSTLVSIAVTPANPTIGFGSTQQFTATGTYANGGMLDITNSVAWSSSNTSAATISSSGNATGVAPGSATITATSGAISGSTTLIVNTPPLVSIAVTPVNPTATVGFTTQFAATATYANNATRDITSSAVWASSNTAVATVSAAGLASAVAVGQTTISASQSGISGSTTLTTTNTPLGSIVPTANLTTPRLSHTATLLNNGRVLIVGGNNHLGPNNTFQSLTSAEIYDPASGTFTATGSLQHARAHHSAILLNNGKVLIVGGLDSTTGTLVTVAEVYDPATGSFSPTGSLGTGRFSASVSILSSGKVLVLGGSGIGVNYVLPVEVYDPATGNFQTVDTLPFQRSGFGTARLNNGKLLIAGGFDNTTNADSTSASLYDLVNGGFASTGSMQVARSGKATLLNSGKALVFGGFLLNGAGPSSFEIYDPTTQAFGSLTSVPQGRYGETDTLLPNGELFLVGGNDNSNSFAKPIAASLLIDPVGLTSAAGPSLNVVREFHTATLLNNGQVLIAGGYLNNDINSAELYTTSSLNLPNLTSIAVTPAAPSLATGAAQRFIATGTFSDGSTQQLAAVVWSSSDANIAQISNDSTNPGVAVGIAPGTITITATVGSVSGSTTLTVP